MDRQHLRFTDDIEKTTTEVEAAGGRIVMSLGPTAVVLSLPEGISPSGLATCSAKPSADLEEGEQIAVAAWKAQGTTRRTLRRMVVPKGEGKAWGSRGLAAPEHYDPRPRKRRGRAARSTGTPTSRQLTGSVAVGVVLVSGYPWQGVAGKLKHVSAAADGTVWGVNNADNIFRRSGNRWTHVGGKLKQISVGSRAHIWGVNSANRIFRRSGNTWQHIAGTLKHVSVADDGVVWGVNGRDDIFRRSGNRWIRVAGKLKQISVGRGNQVWGVNKNDDIFQRVGNRWQHIPGKLKYVSVARDGSVWGVNKSDHIFRRVGASWERVGGRLKQISVASRNKTWGVNSADNIYHNRGTAGLEMTSAQRLKVMKEVIEGAGYLATAHPRARVSFHYEMRHVVVGSAPGPYGGQPNAYERYEAGWRNDAMRQIGFAGSYGGVEAYVRDLRKRKRTRWAYVAFFTHYPLNHFAYAGGVRLVMDYANDGWGVDNINRVFAHETGHIFGAADEYGSCGCGPSGDWAVANNNCTNCTTNQVPCLMNANTLEMCEWTAGQIGWSLWTPIGGRLKHVSTARDGTVWGVNQRDDIFRRSGSGWTHVAGKLKQISTGSRTQVWGVNAADQVYQRVGSSWRNVAGRLKYVSVAADGTVWGVNSADDIFRRTGNRWTHVAGKLKQISVGSRTQVWGVNKSDHIFRRSGNRWVRVPGSLKHVSVGADGSVWGVNRKDAIFKWFQGKWAQVPGKLKQVSCAGQDLTWGVNAADHIYRWDPLT